MSADCLKNLIGLKSLCSTPGQQPPFYIDDIEGLSLKQLADLASERDGSGKALANHIIDSSVRLMLADIDSLIPANYRIQNELMSLCSGCNFSPFYTQAMAAGTGVTVYNNLYSKYATISVNSLKVKTLSSGTYKLIISDGNTEKIIERAFESNIEYDISNVGYQTNSNQVKIYFANPEAKLSIIDCPVVGSCGCGSSTAKPDITIKGLQNGIETNEQCGILPCVSVQCGYDNVICDLVSAAPRMYGLALLYLAASKIFEENVLSQRVNRTASTDKEKKESESERYYLLYRERLTGNPKKGVRGIAHVLNDGLRNVKDKCITCISPIAVSWAV